MKEKMITKRDLQNQIDALREQVIMANGRIRALEYDFNRSTADVRKNVYAHWLKEEFFGGIFICSNCGKYIDFKGLKGTPDPTNFCPYCGAQMNEGKEDGEIYNC